MRECKAHAFAWVSQHLPAVRLLLGAMRWLGHAVDNCTYTFVCTTTHTGRRETIHLNTNRKGTGGETRERVMIPGDCNDTSIMHA